MTEQTNIVPVSNATPEGLIRLALEKGSSIEELRELMALRREWEADQARRSFAEAMVAFKAKPIAVLKDKKVSFGQTAYSHATIGNVVSVVVERLHEHGFSHSWKPSQKDGKISVTCVVRHRGGHEEETTLEAAPDQSGGKNSIQAVASTVTYLERYTLLAATGVATVDQMDDDGRGSDGDSKASREAEWVTAIEGAIDLTELQRIKADLSVAYARAVPPGLTGPYNKRLKQLQGNSA